LLSLLQDSAMAHWVSYTEFRYGHKSPTPWAHGSKCKAFVSCCPIEIREEDERCPYCEWEAQGRKKDEQQMEEERRKRGIGRGSGENRRKKMRMRRKGKDHLAGNNKEN
jgi:hypothetical protein